MKALVLSAAILLGIASTPGLAGAQPSTIEGTYASSFEEVANNCEGAGMSLGRADVVLGRSGEKLTVAIPQVPQLSGRVRKGGKIKAEAEKKNRARYAVSGRSIRGKLQMVFIAEYYTGGKPLCTQSWNVTGTRK